MYGKFAFCSVAQLYATNLNIPVTILLGSDNFYWVVDRHKTKDFLDKGWTLISTLN